ANTNMLALQEELTSTENRVGVSRQSNNDAAMRLNNALEQWPCSILASFGQFKQLEFFEVEAPEERKAVKVQF
ncbi:MAG: LemA family protein, partial [Planctomycetota bacterium]